jgi:transposase-like protein
MINQDNRTACQKENDELERKLKEEGKKPKDPKSIGVGIFEVFARYPDEMTFIKEFIERKYPHGVYCSHCGSVQVTHRKKTPKKFQCNACNNSFSIFTSSVFHHTKIDLRKWIYALHFMINAKKGVSACQLHRGIGGSYKTAWRMMHEIRNAMGDTVEREEFETIIEVDETYVGGKPRKGDGKVHKRGRGTRKTPVVGVLGRDNKKIHARVALPNKQSKKLTGKQLLLIIEEVAAKSANIFTDEFRSYRILGKNGYQHSIVNHSSGQYVRGNTHVNTVESFWAILKRGIIGSFHHVSVEYLQAYVNEFCFRYNHRFDEDNFEILMDRCVG